MAGSTAEDVSVKVESFAHTEALHQDAEKIDATGLTLGGSEEKALIRKLDLHVIPLIMGMYVCSFLDRVNIGNARLYGMEKDLQLHGSQYQTIVSLVFVTYVIFEVPSNMVLKRFTPRYWLSFIMFMWGIVATCSGLCNTFGQMVACRLLLGAFEAGLFPGMTIYLTMFYSKRELGLRIGYLFVCSALAGAFGGLLAFAIGNMDGVAGLRGWRWILIIEGLPTLVVAVLAFFLLVNDADSAYFFTEQDKMIMHLRRNMEYGQTASAQEFDRKDALKAIKDWTVLGMCLSQFCITIMLYGFSAFLPTIIKDLGHWTAAQVQLMTVPVYILGASVYMIGAFFSDRFEKRAAFILPACASCLLGYALLISHVNSAAGYAACFLVAMGNYIVTGLPLAWMANNTPRFGKRAVASGLQISVGAMAGTVSPFVYPTADAPRYTMGHAITLGMIVLAMSGWGFLWYHYDLLNRRRADGTEDWKIQGMTDEQVAEMGDDSPRFVYTT